MPAPASWRRAVGPRPRAQRRSNVELRYGDVVIARPRSERDRRLPDSVALRPIELCEVDSPASIESVHRRLMTTHPTAQAAAWEIAR